MGNLTGENATNPAAKIKAEGNWDQARDAHKMWRKMADCILRLANEILDIA